MKHKYDQELNSHQEDIANFNADKKRILSSTEEASLEAVQGEFLLQFAFSKCSIMARLTKNLFYHQVFVLFFPFNSVIERATE